MMCFTYHFMLAIGQDPVVAWAAWKYLMIAMPGFFGLAQYNIISTYMTAQKELIAPIYCTTIAFVVHIICLYFFESYLNLGLEGVAIATSIHLATRWIIIQFLLQRHPRFKEYAAMNLWGDAWANLKDQFWFSMKSMPQTALPWWGADAFTFISTYLATNVLAAQTIIRNITLLTFMIPVGISIVSGIMISNAIGANKVSLARYWSKIGVSIAMFWSVTILLLLNLFKH